MLRKLQILWRSFVIKYIKNERCKLSRKTIILNDYEGNLKMIPSMLRSIERKGQLWAIGNMQF